MKDRTIARVLLMAFSGGICLELGATISTLIEGALFAPAAIAAELPRRDAPSSYVLPESLRHFPRAVAAEEPRLCRAQPFDSRLVATFVGVGGSSWASFASKDGVRTLGLGDRVDESYVLEAIERGAIRLADGACGAIEVAFDASRSAPTSPALPIALARAEIEDAMAHPEKLLGEVRVVPALEHGSLIGFRLLKVDPAGRVAKLGLQSGDVLEKVDGRPVADLSRLGEIQKLLDRRNVELEVRRNGEVVRLEVTIR